MDNIKTDALKGPFIAFRSNAVRLDAMRIMPALVAAHARLFERFKRQAQAERETNTALDIDARIPELLADWNASNDEIARGEYIDRYGAGVFARMSSGPLRQATEAMLIAQITGAWTAFETLAGDLWEAAINFHPHTLSELKGKGKPQGLESAASQQSGEKQQKPDKMLPISLIQKFKFDLSRTLGTLLKDKFNFTSLNAKNGIRAAYWEAFDDEHVRQSIDSECLRALSCVRNVLVHKAGVIDDVFRAEMGKIPLLTQLASSRRISITGELVHNLVHPCMDAACDLVHSVDQWLDLHRGEEYG